MQNVLILILISLAYVSSEDSFIIRNSWNNITRKIESINPLMIEDARQSSLYSLLGLNSTAVCNFLAKNSESIKCRGPDELYFALFSAYHSTCPKEPLVSHHKELYKNLSDYLPIDLFYMALANTMISRNNGNDSSFDNTKTLKLIENLKNSDSPSLSRLDHSYIHAALALFYPLDSIYSGSHVLNLVEELKKQFQKVDQLFQAHLDDLKICTNYLFALERSSSPEADTYDFIKRSKILILDLISQFEAISYHEFLYILESIKVDKANLLDSNKSSPPSIPDWVDSILILGFSDNDEEQPHVIYSYPSLVSGEEPHSLTNKLKIIIKTNEEKNDEIALLLEMIPSSTVCSFQQCNWALFLPENDTGKTAAFTINLNKHDQLIPYTGTYAFSFLSFNQDSDLLNIPLVTTHLHFYNFDEVKFFSTYDAPQQRISCSSSHLIPKAPLSHTFKKPVTETNIIFAAFGTFFCSLIPLSGLVLIWIRTMKLKLNLFSYSVLQFAFCILLLLGVLTLLGYFFMTSLLTTVKFMSALLLLMIFIGNNALSRIQEMRYNISTSQNEKN